MHFVWCLQQGKAKKVIPNHIRAHSFIKAANEAVATACSIHLRPETAKSVIRELYEGLRECCEAIGFAYGYKFLDHESIAYFLRDIIKEESVAKKFDRYRKLRNGINYEGHDIELVTVKEALVEIPELMKYLEKYG